MLIRPLLCALLLSCSSAVDDSASRSPVPWDRGLPDLAEQSAPEGFRWARSIVHLHSPWSHDACDGAHDDGEPIDECLADFREAICATRLDAVFVTDHPDYAAFETVESLLWFQEGDELLLKDGQPIANRMACDNGHAPVYMPGFEDALMPVGMEAHYSDDQAERHALYNEITPEAVEAMVGMGAVVLVAHTEQRDFESLSPLAEHGLAGVELFNLHAMVDPNIRPEFLGLDGTEWLKAAKPFTSLEGDAEPDLMFLAFYQEQTVSTALWDALSAVGPTVGVAGTDAHQNVLNLPMRDGERLDSYRRMIRWFSNWLLVVGEGPQAYKDALAAGRNFAVFEAFGTPEDLDVYGFVDGQRMEIGSDLPLGSSLEITCPTLAPSSPQSLAQPEIKARVLKDGELFAEGCASHMLSAPGVYRVVFDITPHHLDGFLGKGAQDYMRPTPWIYSNPLRVGL
jgi:hypothetical protein